MKKTIYISVINDLVTDQRVKRIAETLVALGADVEVIGRKLPDSRPFSPADYDVFRMKLLINKGFFFYAFYNIRLFFYLLTRRNIHLLVSNDLDTLAANYLVSKIKRKTLVYDSHEYFTEVPELNNRPLVKSFWKFLERSILPGIKHAYTVNASLASIYHRTYGTNFEVVRNLPRESQKISLYQLPEWTAGKKIIIYQGAVNMERGIETVIEAVREMNDVIFIIAGTGDVYEEIKRFIHRENLQSKILMTGRLLPDQLRSVTSQAHLGISLEKNTNLNYYYALPNKLFDYIHAGIPALVSNFPEMEAIVNNYMVGLVADPENVSEIKAKIKMMLFDEKKRREWIQNTAKARTELKWENEQKKVISLYIKAGFELEKPSDILTDDDMPHKNPVT